MSLAYTIPVLNCIKYTRLAIASIRFQPNDHLFLIDNGSTDETQAEMLELSKTLPMTYVRHEENTGVAAAWNEGMKLAFKAGHMHVLVMNNDVILAEDTVPALLRWQKESGGVVSAHSVVTVHALQYVDRHHTFTEPCDYSCFLITKAIVDKVGWFDTGYWPAYFEDYDYDCRLEVAGIPRGHAGDAVVCHFPSRTINEGGIKNHEEYFKKNYKRWVGQWGLYIRQRGHRLADRV